MLGTIIWTLVFAIATASFDYVGQWDALPTMPHGRSDMTASAVTNHIYIIGGCSGKQEFRSTPAPGYYCVQIESTVMVYNTLSKTYSMQTEMAQPRHRHAAAAVGPEIFIFGGRDGNDDLVHEIDVYDTRTETWTTIPNTNASYSDWHAVTYFGKIVVVGGYNQDYQAQATALIFNPQTRSWEGEYPSMGTARGDLALTVVGDKIFAVGGFTHENDFQEPLSTVEMFDPAVRAWTVIDSLDTARGDKLTAAINGRLHVLGGQPGAVAIQPLLDVEVFDPTLNIWIEEVSFPTHTRFRFAGAVIDNLWYIFGGQGELNGDVDTEDSFYPISKEAEIFNETRTYVHCTAPSTTGPLVVSSISLVVALLGAVGLLVLRGKISKAPQTTRTPQAIVNPDFED